MNLGRGEGDEYYYPVQLTCNQLLWNVAIKADTLH